ncbi:hypothetical protein [Hoeflea sp. 108]|jgi:hypothetical protein|uniref:hypothetical protein n=1 Tax=Hoeflea sp. 108 TaxID=1116369 RepID=UPI0012F946C0|nr:hypothetical protein [Hoeflea sp. 108]
MSGRTILRNVLAGSFLLGLPLPTAHAAELPTDAAGYSQHLRELCLSGAESSMPGTSIVAAGNFCSLYIEIPIASTTPCADTPEACTQRFIGRYFNVRLSRLRQNYTYCDDQVCKVYYNFRDPENRYESLTECGFDIGGIARVDAQRIVMSLVSISINRNCLAGV